MDGPAEAARAVCAAFRRGGIDGVLARLAPDVLWDHNRQRDAPEAARRGRVAVRGFVRPLGTVEFLRVEPQGLLSEGSMVAVPLEVETRSRLHEGVMRDLETSLWTFGADGLVTHRRASVDSHAMAAVERV